MKFCKKCGRELLDEAVVCVGCGCAVSEEEKNNFNKELDQVEIQKRIRKNKRVFFTVSSVTIIIALLIMISIPIVNLVKTNRIIKELYGETFECNQVASYSVEREGRYTFDDEGNCEYYSYNYYLKNDEVMEYTLNYTYEIEFKNGSAYVVLDNDDKFKIKYDEDGKITSLYDTGERKTYERR